MGFVRGNLYIEEYLADSKVKWTALKDSEFTKIYKEIDSLIDSKKYTLTQDDVFSKLCNRLPFSGYILSTPGREHLFSIYECGVDLTPFGYLVEDVQMLNRDKLNNIPSPIVFADKELSFLCRLNIQWREMSPEIFLDKNV